MTQFSSVTTRAEFCLGCRYRSAGQSPTLTLTPVSTSEAQDYCHHRHKSSYCPASQWGQRGWLSQTPSQTVSGRACHESCLSGGLRHSQQRCGSVQGPSSPSEPTKHQIGQVHTSLEVSKTCRFKSSGKGDGSTAALDALMQRAQYSFKKGFLC